MWNRAVAVSLRRNPLLRFAHDRLTYIDPQPHREIFLVGAIWILRAVIR